MQYLKLVFKFLKQQYQYLKYLAQDEQTHYLKLIANLKLNVDTLSIAYRTDYKYVVKILK